MQYEPYKQKLKPNEGKPASGALSEALYTVKERLSKGEKFDERELKRTLEEKGFLHGEGDKYYFIEKGKTAEFDSKALRKEVERINFQRREYERIRNVAIPEKPGLLTRVFDREGYKEKIKDIEAMTKLKQSLPEKFNPNIKGIDKLWELKYKEHQLIKTPGKGQGELEPKVKDQSSDFKITSKDVEMAFSKSVAKVMEGKQFNSRADARHHLLKEEPKRIVSELVNQKGLSNKPITADYKNALIDGLKGYIGNAIKKDIEVEKRAARNKDLER